MTNVRSDYFNNSNKNWRNMYFN